MWKQSRCVISIYNNEMPYPELNKKSSNVNGDIMHKLPNDGAVKAT